MLQNSLMYSSHWNYKEVPVNIFPNANVSWDMGDIRVISTADSLCGSHAGQHNFQLFIVAGKSHPSVLNIRRSLSVPKPQLHRINDRGSYRPVEWASTYYPPSTEGQIQVPVWQLGGAPSRTKHMCWRWSRGTSHKSNGKSLSQDWRYMYLLVC